MYRLFIVLLLMGFAATNSVFAEDPPEIVWNKTFDTGDDDWGEDITVDADGYIYVTGNTWNGFDHDWLTIKYDANGDTVWARIYSSGSGEDDVASGIAADTRNVYVVGWMQDWRIIKYDALTGTIIWNKTRDWDDTDQGAHSVALDQAGFVYVGGDVVDSGDWDYLTIKYNSDGDTLWERIWESGVNENVWAITVDAAGFVYATGNVWNVANVDWLTIKYDVNGDTVWTRTYDSGNSEYLGCDPIAVDNTGNVYIGGWVENATSDWQIVKYDANGNQVWEKTIDSGNHEGVWDIVVDSAKYVYIHGDIFNGVDWDYRTMKYDSNTDVMLWDVIYDSGDNDQGRGMAIDDSGFVYVTGFSYNGMNFDCRTIKYEQKTAVAEQPQVNYSLFTLEVVNNPTSVPILRYAIPAGMQGSLSFYFVDGRKIEEFSLNSSCSTFTWDTSELPSGVYFVRLVCGNHTLSDKICLTK